VGDAKSGNVIAINGASIIGRGVNISIQPVKVAQDNWLVEVRFDVPGKGATELSGSLELREGGDRLTILAESDKTHEKTNIRLLRCTAAPRILAAVRAANELTAAPSIKVPPCDTLAKFPLQNVAINSNPDELLRWFFGKPLELWTDADLQLFKRGFFECRRLNGASFFSAYLQSPDYDHFMQSSGPVEEAAKRLGDGRKFAIERAADRRVAQALVSEVQLFAAKGISSDDEMQQSMKLYDRLRDFEREPGVNAAIESLRAAQRTFQTRREQQRASESAQANEDASKKELLAQLGQFFMLYQLSDVCASRGASFQKAEVSRLQELIQKFSQVFSSEDRDGAWKLANQAVGMQGFSQLDLARLRQECGQLRQQMTYFAPSMFAGPVDRSPF
jgi:hypothetical protein